MTLAQIQTPYPVFTDKDGKPLDDGYVFFGVPNLNPETNPIEVFYDPGLTEPAPSTKGFRTVNGYIMRNGSPALLYAASLFSVTVRNKRKELVIYAPVGYATSPYEIGGPASEDVIVVAGIAADVTAVAAIAPEIADLGPLAADIATVASIEAQIVAVAADASDIGTVATNIASVNAVAADIADITAVAADAADIGTVAANIADVNTVATNIVDVTNFADVYIGPAAADPLTRTDGSPLQTGDLYFNTVSDRLFIYDGGAWNPAAFDTGGALLAINNLSDVANAATARTNLGLAIGSNVQAWDADLDAVAALGVDAFTTTVGGGSVKTLTYSPPVTAYVTGRAYTFRNNSDNTGAASVNIDGLGNVSLVKFVGLSKSAIEVGDLLQGGLYRIYYDGTDFILMNPSRLVGRTLTSPVINGTVTGTALADQATMEAGAVDDELATPLGVAQAIDAQVPALFNATGAAPLYACRAWVNFNGTGTVAIRASGNVSSITDNGTGVYTVNFTTAMEDANYTAVGTGRGPSGGARDAFISFGRDGDTYSTTALQVYAFNAAAALLDESTVNIAVFR